MSNTPVFRTDSDMQQTDMGPVSKGWEVVNLKNICNKIGSGATPRGGKSTYKETGISLIRSQNVLDFNFTKSGLVFMDENQARKLSNVEIELNDVLINITGDSVARVCQVPDYALPARVNQHVAILRPHDKTNPKYLKYYLLAPQNKGRLLNMSGVGGTRNALTKGMLESFEIALPPLPEQKRIAEILGALDDQIDTLTAMNKTLEVMGAAMFKSWFVDFDGVTEWEDGREGEVPKGWHDGVISDIGKVVCGKTPPTKNEENFGGQVPFITIPDMRAGVFAMSTQRTLSDIGTSTQPKKTLPPYSICISCIATPGLVTVTSKASQTNQQINSIIPNKMTSWPFVYYAMRDLSGRIGRIGTGGSVFANLSKGRFEQMDLVIPSDQILLSFHAMVNPLLELQKENQSQIQTLRAIRDALLPQLVGGRLVVNPKIA